MLGSHIEQVEAPLDEYWMRDFGPTFVLDDERLKQGKQVFGRDYFDELLERIREIRASERRFYQKITDIYVCADVERPQFCS